MMNANPREICGLEWISSGKLYLLDPEVQHDANTWLLFDTAELRRTSFLRWRAKESMREASPGRTLDLAVAHYQEWKKSQAKDRAKPAQRKKSAEPWIRKGLSDAAAVRIPDGPLEADLKIFAGLFSDLFADEKYIDEERTYKLKAGAKIREALNEDAYLTASDDELVARVRSAFSAKHNLLYQMEHSALHGALSTNGPHLIGLARAFQELMWGDGPEEQRMTRWMDAVEALPQTGGTSPFKWPVVTALPFLANPDKHCILKPLNAQATAANYGVHLRYLTHPNYSTYRRWLDLVDAIGEKLVGFGARDRIDVQSFIWRVHDQKRRFAGVN